MVRSRGRRRSGLLAASGQEFVALDTLSDALRVPSLGDQMEITTATAGKLLSTSTDDEDFGEKRGHVV